MAIQNYYNKKGNFDKFWWVSPEIVPKESGMINLSVANRYKDYGKLKGSVWKWFRSQVNQKDLSPRNKIILWSLAERFRGQSFSVWDSYTYLSKMVGLSRKTFSKGMGELSEQGIIWIAVEGDERMAFKKLPQQVRVKKHILLVGLNNVLYEDLKEV
jgi:hypothetical protein|tara:strand:- start:7 stop:477 length:471 start_codon:yes stop_codon:yes gene_type:complete